MFESSVQVKAQFDRREANRVGIIPNVFSFQLFMAMALC